MILSRMTWQECRDGNVGKKIAILPLGSTEQHGPHLPCDTDSRLVTGIAESVEREIQDEVLLLPTVWQGHSPHHLDFGATISMDHNTYTQMLCAILRSVISMGIQCVLLLNGHGGNRVPAMAAIQQMKDESPETRICMTDYFSLASKQIQAIGTGDVTAMGHAGELETSLYLFFCRDGVRRDRIADDGWGNCPAGEAYQGYMMKGTPLFWVDNFKEITASGAFGKPSFASEEKGAQFAGVIRDEVVKLLKALREMEEKRK